MIPLLSAAISVDEKHLHKSRDAHHCLSTPAGKHKKRTVPVTQHHRHRLHRRSHEMAMLLRVEALLIVTFSLLKAAAGLIWIPRPQQQLPPSQHGARNQIALGCSCFSSVKLPRRVCCCLGSPWAPCYLMPSDSREASSADDVAASSAVAAAGMRLCFVSPIMSGPLSRRGRSIHRGGGLSRRFFSGGVRSATAIRGSAAGEESRATKATPTTSDTAAVELDHDPPKAGPDDGSVEIRRDSGSGDELGAEAGRWRKWGARLGIGRNRKTGGVGPEDGGKQEVQVPKERTGIFTYDWENGRRVKWVASKRSRAVVEEGPRKLSDYLALPPTEYSVLDPKMITRLTEETFMMDCGNLNIVGTKVNPVVFVRVNVRPEEKQANIVVERVELDGSEAVRGAGGTFNVTSTTVVTSAEIDDGNPKTRELQTQADIEIEILVPNENFVPLGVLSRAGSFVMQRVCDIGLPQFTRFLRRDYAKWSEGDDSRSAVACEDETLIESSDP